MPNSDRLNTNPVNNPKPTKDESLQSKPTVRFEDLSKKDQTEAQKSIIRSKRKLLEVQPISIDKWCIEHEIPVKNVIRLLNKANMPILRFGKSVTAYEDDINQVIQDERERKIEMQIKNRFTARHTAKVRIEKKKSN